MSFEQICLTFPKIGCDEVGKGDFFGPLVAASVFISEPESVLGYGLRDSKKISDSKVKQLAPRLMATQKYSLVKILPKRYNELYSQFRNINKILGWAHARAIKNLLETGLKPDVILIDKFGPEGRVLSHFSRDTAALRDRFHFYNRAEDDLAVAAASIVARFTFLREMEIMSNRIGVKIPLGAGAEVDRIALEIAGKSGPGLLSDLVKLHFKNYDRVRDGLKKL